METLALYAYPIPNGTRYTENDLANKEKVIELFDYCQILKAVISKNGWDFLIRCYGYNQLFDLNQISGWLDCTSVEEFISFVEYEKEIAPDKL